MIQPNTVITGDSLTVLRSMDDESVDMVITDPPYGIDYEDKDGNHRKATEITVSSVHFCDSKKDGAGASHQDTGGDFADYPDSSGDFTEVDDNGDLPF